MFGLLPGEGRLFMHPSLSGTEEHYIADILYYFAEIIHIAGIFAFLYPLTDFITENPAVIFVSREGEKASGIREHADAYRQQAKGGKHL